MAIMISIPDECKPLADAVLQVLACLERALHRADGGRALDYGQVEREVGARVADVERAAHQRLLTALDVDAPAVVIDGHVHTRVHRVEGRYYTLAGDVVVMRSLYRSQRHAKVVDPITLRTGALEGGWLPDTAAAMAHLLQQGPLREAEATMRATPPPRARRSARRGHRVPARWGSGPAAPVRSEGGVSSVLRSPKARSSSARCGAHAAGVGLDSDRSS